MITDALVDSCDQLAELMLDVLPAIDWVTEDLTTGAGDLVAAAVALPRSEDASALTVELTVCLASADQLINFDVLTCKVLETINWFAGREIPGLGVLTGLGDPDLSPEPRLLDPDTFWLSSVTATTLLTFTPDA